MRALYRAASILKMRLIYAVGLITMMLLAGSPLLILLPPSAAYALSPDTGLSAADASFIGEDAGDQSGSSVASAGDVNGDGYDDILIGAFGNEGGGQTYLILGKASGWGTDTDLSAADGSFIGEDAGDLSGSSVASAGDVNGDGYDDILIGAYGDDDGGGAAGQTYLILGKASGWATDTGLSAADGSFIGEDADDQSGYSVASAGDVNGDGYDDILIGANGNDDSGSDAGQTYLITSLADTVDPSVQVLWPNGDEFWAGGSSHEITWTASDAKIASDPITIEYFDGSGWTEIATALDNNGSYTWTVPAIDILNARIKVTAIDEAGNSGSDDSDGNFTMDSTRPTVDIDSITDYINSLNEISGTASDNAGLDKVQVQITNTTDNTYWNGTSWQNDATSVNTTGTSSWSYALPALEDEQYTITAKATDKAGNESDEVTDYFTYDTDAPSKPSDLTRITPDYYNNPKFTWSVSNDTLSGVSSYEVKIDSEDFVETDDVPIFVAAAALSDGFHTFYVRAKDVAGNIGQTASVSFDIDTTIRINPDTPTNLSPMDSATDVGIAPTLESSSFSDPNPDDTHGASQWQISTVSGNYTSLTFDSDTDNVNITSINTPAETLHIYTTYYWRVRHQDNYGGWSDWSAETSFRTEDIVEETIDSGGGTIETPSQDITIVLPTGAVENETPIVLTVREPDQMPPTPSGHTLCATVFTIDGVEDLNSTATITVTYTAADMEAAGGNTGLLALNRYDGDTEQWVRLSTRVNTADQTLTTSTDHFGLWATMVRPLNFWEQSRMWFLISGLIIVGILLALFLKGRQSWQFVKRNKK